MLVVINLGIDFFKIICEDYCTLTYAPVNELDWEKRIKLEFDTDSDYIVLIKP